MATVGPNMQILVTGFPNFRGRKAVEHILATEPAAQVVAVVKEDFHETAEACLKTWPAARRKRVKLLRGDAAAMDFGLSGEEYVELCGSVTHLLHTAQVTYPGASREMADNVNLGGAREVVEFCRQSTTLQSALVFSSAGVSGDRTGLVRERDLMLGQSFRTPVEASLARAERLLSRYMPELPITIVRPTQIIGDSRTGEVDRFDGPYLVIMLIVSSPPELPVPLPTRGDAPMNLVPIDFVVDAALRLLKEPRARGRTFHIADPRPLSVRRVYELVANAGGKRLSQGFIPTRVSKAVLSAAGASATGRSHKALVDFLATPVRYDTSGFDEILGGELPPCPPFETYVDALVAFVNKRVQERRQQQNAALEELDDALL
ncbi:MAG: SDR family oxidoreductase [Polyangiaceae bacterium]